MHFSIITLFPEIFDCLQHGMTGRAIKQGNIDLAYWNPRDFTNDKRRTVDDRPYGGGPGMLMKVKPLRQAIQAAKQAQPRAKLIYLSPAGKRFNQKNAIDFSHQQSLILLAGRYEGIDERVIKHDVDEVISIGDYVLTGGELAAAVMIDSITRLLPGVLGHECSALEDSFIDNLLDYPHYTRPETVDGQGVPSVLLRGHHAEISRWRLKQALGRTWQQRPDLLATRKLSADEQALLDEFIAEQQEDKPNEEH